MTDYAADAADVLASLTAEGQAITLLDTPAAAASVDGTTGLPVASPPSATSYGTYGIVLPHGQLSLIASSEATRALAGRDLVQSRVQGVMIAASGLGVTPLPRMRLQTAAGDEFEVLAVATLEPAGVAIFHELLVAA